MGNYELTHPLYLDVQMMYSFLAFLDGGFSLEDEQVSKSSMAKGAAAQASASVKFPSFFHLFGAELAGEGDLASKLERMTEYKAARHRTEASLFNYLHSRLHKDGEITKVDKFEDLEGVHTGQLVELAGRYEGNPLSEILGIIVQFFSYLDLDKTKPKAVGNVKRSGDPRVRNATPVVPSAENNYGIGSDAETRRQVRVFTQMHSEIVNCPVRDVVIRTFGGLRTVQTTSSEYFTNATGEFLRQGEVKVLGKLTRTLGQDEKINLARRTLMAVATEEVVMQTINGFTSSLIDFTAPDPFVRFPAIQVLPMAIFV